MAHKFELKKRLGAGFFGEVWYAIETALDVPVALKLIDKAKILDPANPYDEAKLLAAGQHENVVAVREAGPFDENRFYIAMEFLKKGSLEDETKGDFLEPSRAKRIMIDVLRGLEHLHKNGILHRDMVILPFLMGPDSRTYAANCCFSF